MAAGDACLHVRMVRETDRDQLIFGAKHTTKEGPESIPVGHPSRWFYLKISCISQKMVVAPKLWGEFSFLWVVSGFMNLHSHVGGSKSQWLLVIAHVVQWVTDNESIAAHCARVPRK